MSPAGLVVAALNAAWQAGLLVLIAGGILRVLRSNASGYAAVWTAVFFTGVALMPLDVAVQLHAASKPAVPLLLHAARSTSPGGLAPIAERLPSALTSLGGTPVARSAAEAPAAVATLISSAAERVALPFLTLWVLVAGWQLLRLWRASALLRQLKSRAVLLHDAPPALLAMTDAVRGASIAICEGIEIPCAVGFARPMVLLPASLASRLQQPDLYATVAHEVAHLRRYDDVLQLAQQFFKALFFFNPALRVASRRIDFYREAACDERVISSRASALRYAECLATIAERTLRYRQSAAPALVHGPRQVTARVERLVNWKEGPRNMGRVALLLTLAVCATAMFFARVEIPMIFSHHGSPQPDRDTVIVVAHSDVDDSTLLGALAAAGYKPSVDETIAISNAGVDSDLIVAIGRSGMERPSVGDLIAMANAGVDSDLMSSAVRAFGASISASDLIRLQNSGVDADDIADLRVASPDMSIGDLIALHEAGVDADYIRHLTRAGHGHLSVIDVIRLHEAGVDT